MGYVHVVRRPNVHFRQSCNCGSSRLPVEGYRQINCPKYRHIPRGKSQPIKRILPEKIQSAYRAIGVKEVMASFVPTTSDTCLVICASLGTAWCASAQGQLVQQHLGLLQIRRVKPFGEPAIDRRHQGIGSWRLSWDCHRRARLVAVLPQLRPSRRGFCHPHPSLRAEHESGPLSDLR